MRGNCVICSDLFDEINSISAAPCGHVYHASCLSMWVSQSSRTCPQCRSRTDLKSILKLYFNFLPKSNANSSDLENEITNLKAQLSAKNVELVAAKKLRDDTVVFVRDAEKRASDLQQRVYKLEYEVSELRLKAKSASKLEQKVLKLEKMNAALTNDMELLNNVQTIVNGTQKDVEDILKEYDDHSGAAKQLATYCTFLKRELQKVVESKNKLADLNNKLKCENSLYAARIKSYESALEKPRNLFQGKMVTPAKLASPFSSRENLFSADTPSTSKGSSVSEEIDISPLSVTFNNKNKFNMCIKTSTTVYKPESCSQNNLKFTNMTSLPLRKKNDDSSLIRTGYNGLGGHSNFIGTSGIKKIKITKKK